MKALSISSKQSFFKRKERSMEVEGVLALFN